MYNFVYRFTIIEVLYKHIKIDIFKNGLDSALG